MHNYIVVDNLITKRSADNLINLIEDILYEEEECNCPNHELQKIIELPKTSEKAWERIKDFVFDIGLGSINRDYKSYQLIGLSDSVTLSRHNTHIEMHRDKEDKISYRGVKYDDVVCLYKIAIYLNDINSHPQCKAGGTILYDEDGIQRVAIAPKKGRALIFDIRDLHSGAPIPSGKTKYLIGFRLLYRECKHGPQAFETIP